MVHWCDSVVECGPLNHEVRAHALVDGWIPQYGVFRRQLINDSPSLLLSEIKMYLEPGFDLGFETIVLV